MGLVVFVSHVFAGKVSVHLSRSNAGVAQKLLNVSQRRSASQQMRGETMPQRVWCDFLINTGASGVAFQNEPESLACKTLASAIKE